MRNFSKDSLHSEDLGSTDCQIAVCFWNTFIFLWLINYYLYSVLFFLHDTDLESQIHTHFGISMLINISFFFFSPSWNPHEADLKTGGWKVSSQKKFPLWQVFRKNNISGVPLVVSKTGCSTEWLITSKIVSCCELLCTGDLSCPLNLRYGQITRHQ